MENLNAIALVVRHYKKGVQLAYRYPDKLCSEIDEIFVPDLVCFI